MRKALSIFIALALVLSLSALSLAGCRGLIKGSGDLETREYEFNNFTNIEVSHAFEFEITQSNFYSVTVTADDNLFKYIEVSQTGERLEVGMKPNYGYLNTHLKAIITMPELRSLDVSGASTGFIKGFSLSDVLIANISGASSLDLVDITTGDVDFDISGASGVTGSLTANDAKFELSGASRIQLEGSAVDLTVDASSASRVELGSFPVTDADIVFSGASWGTVNLSGTLDADLSGASRLSYIGEPVFGNINTSGASSISKK